MTVTTLSHDAISRFLKPRSIAIVGASDKPGALGASVLTNLERNGYSGAIYPVNPKRETIGTHRCYPSVEALPEGVDVAVLAIPQPAVLDAVKGLAARKAGGAIIFSAGFAEGGEEGKAQQAEIARIAAEHGMVIEGPNCLGAVNYVDAVPLTFVETQALPPAGRRALGVVSQSGAMAAVLGATFGARDLPISYSVSTGNEAASGVEDYVEWLLEDDETHVIAMIVEQFRKPARFLEVAARARGAGKPIVLLHPGKSSAARESAATHTGAMAGDYSLMRRKVEREGVIFAETLEELGDITEILMHCPHMERADIAVLGESGAFKALTLDLAEEFNLPLAHLDDANAPALREALPPFVPVSNPLDITAQGLSQPEIYTNCLTALLDDDRVGAVVAGIIQTDPVTIGIKAPAIRAALDGRTSTKPLIYAGLDEGAPIPEEIITDFRARGIPCFPNAERAIRALSRLAAFARRDLAKGAFEPTPVPGLDAYTGVVAEYQAKELLAPLGLAFPEGGFADSADAAVAVADKVGYPVAMKAQAQALGHKSDAGGVLLNLADADAVRAAWGTIHDNVAAYNAALALDGVLIEKMGARGMEMIVGGRNNPDWGPVVLAGFGGVTAEILKDVCLFTPDMTLAQIEEGLLGLKSAALLSGYRGSPKLDVPALAALVAQVAAVLSAEPSLSELDLNPVILYPEGHGVVALDALMLVEPVAP
ncbi:acetate--CoA ligase family protein [Novosphingobium decolorationis]|uniref:Acetate--CoA ligase family protein n=1 Tax=Novosphingobium decolorationis TaxID=2698673 RepID=A0ABX8E0U6_9SPHN|nr:acetate--CoA ligase family protein [Novosphingobium decolorationis]QVM82742.1 acetate--CoA ligase family protein [Novosphingobium decolorationis]